jgi:hypothetical protein
MWSWGGIIAIREYFVKTKQFQLCALFGSATDEFHKRTKDCGDEGPSFR